MPRNLDRRVEAMVPVDDRVPAEPLDQVIEVASRTTRSRGRRTMRPGRPSPGAHTVDTHVVLQEQARKRTVVDIR